MNSGRRILKNLFSLSVAEIANKGILFITTAYLARVILPEGYGVIGFANSLLVFFSIFVNLGYNVVGAREVAKDYGIIPKLAGQITTIRLILALVSSLVLISIALLIDKPLVVKLVIIISSINLYSQAFLMDWVYQGNEKMEYLALRQVITSLLSLAGIVIFVREPGDVVWAMVITVSSLLINSSWMLLLFNKMYGRLKLGIDRTFLKLLTRSSLPITFSTFFITIFNFLNIIMLGFLRTEEETGYYTAAYKFILLVITPSSIIQNVFFPVLSRASTVESRRSIIRIYGNFIFIVGSILCLVGYMYSDFLIQFTFGSSYGQSAEILQVLMITVLIMYLNTIYFPTLVSWQFEKKVMYAIGAGGAINIILNFILIPMYGPIGAAWSTVFSEIVVLIGVLFITNNVIGRVFVIDKFYVLAIAVVATVLGYGFYNYLFKNEIISSIITVVLFLGMILLTRVVDFKEVRNYMSK